MEEIECGFKANKPFCVQQDWEYAHGRYETRKCSIVLAKDAIDQDLITNWEGMQTIVKIEATRSIKDKISKEIRYYISDENELNAQYFNDLVRGHWGIENHLHWHLDVTFKEDECRARKGNAPQNLSSLRKLALQIITQQNDKLSLKKRRVKAAFDIDYLKNLLKI